MKYHFLSRKNLSLLLSLLIILCTFIAVPFLSLLKSTSSYYNPPRFASAKDAISISAQSAILMEATTGTIVYELDSTKELAPASITKIMTLLLTFEALEKKEISLSDEVTISEHAASMGGSQVFLEPGEIQSVETLIKCVSIASANDGAVALAEFIAGSEEAFVIKMNERAKELKMEHTNFVNCCGLDVDGHITCAYDIALMSRELIIHYPEIYDYCQTWQEDITHNTKKGASTFTLTNTNKLIKQYPYATGLKTGSTSTAKFCVSATACKDNLNYIAVIMAADDHKIRFSDAKTLLDYGFCNTSIYQDKDIICDKSVIVKKSVKDSLSVSAKNDFTYLSTNGDNTSTITKKITLPKSVNAPIKKGQEIGTINYYLGDKEIGKVSLIADSSIKKATLFHYFYKSFQNFLK